MDFEVSYSLDNEQQFWDELDDIISADTKTHELIDNALRSYLRFTANFKGEYLDSEDAVALCAHKLLGSTLFDANKDYVRRQIVYGLLQEDEYPTLHLITVLLLQDGKSDDAAFRMMQEEGAFPRVIELIQDMKESDEPDMSLHRTLLELLYEMSRIVHLTWENLNAVSDDFILYLFRIIEHMSDYAADPNHYATIKVLLVFSEQYLILSSSPTPLPNRVLRCLNQHGHSLKTFGENLILLLNRCEEASEQSLILKLLYLIFSSKSTAEYFYTNDLHVLLDVIIRNLLDLPREGYSAIDLRHLNLRVLYPLLANSQISRTGMGYKRVEVRKTLRLLAGDEMESSGYGHFERVDETTLRLIARCKSVAWLADTPEDKATARAEAGEVEETENGTPVEEASSPTTPSVADAQKELARRMLGMNVKEANESAISVVEVAAHHAKPGVLSPSRARGISDGDQRPPLQPLSLTEEGHVVPLVADKEEAPDRVKAKPPPVPRARRRGSRAKT